jgi:hypothetical protein
MKIKSILGLTLAFAIVLTALFCASCSSGEDSGESAAIESTIRGYVTTFNTGDFTQCLTYFTGYDNEEDALVFLSYMRNLSGEMDLKKVHDVSISTPTTATATVIFTMLGEEGTDQMQMKKIGNQWKILWEEESQVPTPTPEPAQYPGIQTEGCFPSTVEVAPELQGIVQVEHCLWAEGGELYEAWQVLNTGDHVVVLSFKFYVYDAEGQELLLEGISNADVQPGSYMVDCHPCGAMAPPSTTHYRIVVSSW